MTMDAEEKTLLGAIMLLDGSMGSNTFTLQHLERVVAEVVEISLTQEGLTAEEVDEVHALGRRLLQVRREEEKT